MAEVAERSTVDILKAARERISDPERWTTGAYARGEDGAGACPATDHACKWCAYGALLAELGVNQPGPGTARYDTYLENAAEDISDSWLTSAVEVNDEGSHPDALHLLDRAIQLAEQEATRA